MKKKIIFKTIEEARMALSDDRLGTVYIKAHEVFVVTAWGSGKFSREDWDKSREQQTN